MFYDFFATSAKYSTEVKELVSTIHIFLMHAMHCRKNKLFRRANHMWNSLPAEIHISYNSQRTQKLLSTLRPIIRFRCPIQFTNRGHLLSVGHIKKRESTTWKTKSRCFKLL